MVAVVLGALLAPSHAAAAAPNLAQDSGDEFDADEAQGTVDTVRRALIGIAIGTGAMLVLYIWHTDPRRRFEVATRRRERREAEQRFGLEDEFVLPADIDDLEPD
jgi:hypothetical protein